LTILRISVGEAEFNSNAISIIAILERTRNPYWKKERSSYTIYYIMASFI
jgi:hypothetical protein